MKTFLKLMIIQFFMAWNLSAKTLDAHVHGDVHLDIATEKTQLLVMLKAPAESFLGFEYKAKTQEEKKLLKKVKNEWTTQLLALLGPNALKDCIIEKSKWEQVFSGKNHSSVIAESYIRCKRPLQKRLLQVAFKKNYNRIKSVKLQLLREDGSAVNKKYTTNEFRVRL